MANICIRTINYVTSGKYSKYFDLDIGYTPEDYNIVELIPELDSTKYLGENDTYLLLYPNISDYYYEKYLKNKYIRNAVYVASIESNLNSSIDTKENKNNLYSLFDKDDLNIIHNLYDIKDVCILTNIKDNNDKFIDLYGPSLNSNLIGIVQNTNYVYCLTEQLSTTLNYTYTTLNSQRKNSVTEIRSIDYVNVLSSTYIDTFNYASNNDIIDISTNYNIGTTIKNMKYNYIFEMQNNQYYNDFEEGNVYGDVFVGKNAYNSLYSTNMSVENRIDNCRKYVGIGICGNNIYLKYTDDLTYIGKKDDTILLVDKVIDEINNFTYLKVETVQSINRFSDGIKHRTNLYSLKINNTGLDELDVSDRLKKLKLQIKMDINNNIEEIVKNVCPVHTLLLSVEFKN